MPAQPARTSCCQVNRCVSNVTTVRSAGQALLGARRARKASIAAAASQHATTVQQGCTVAQTALAPTHAGLAPTVHLVRRTARSVLWANSRTWRALQAANRARRARSRKGQGRWDVSCARLERSNLPAAAPSAWLVQLASIKMPSRSWCARAALVGASVERASRSVQIAMQASSVEPTHLRVTRVLRVSSVSTVLLQRHARTASMASTAVSE